MNIVNNNNYNREHLMHLINLMDSLKKNYYYFVESVVEVIEEENLIVVVEN